MKRVFCVVISLALLMSNCIIASANTIHNPVKVGSTSVWDCIWLGKYPQSAIKSKTFKYDNSEMHHELMGNALYDNNNKYLACRLYEGDLEHYKEDFYKYDPVKWRVLKVEGNAALLVSDKVLDRTVYTYGRNKDSEYSEIDPENVNSVNWGGSHMNSYMNTLSVNIAPSNKEYEAIIKHPITTVYPSIYQGKTITESLNRDRLFLLSYDEINDGKYAFDLKKPETVKAEYTEFANLRKLGDSVNNKYDTNNRGYYLLCRGWIINQSGNLGRQDELYVNGVRPAMWVDLTKANYQYAGTVKSDGTGIELLYKVKKGRVKKAIKASKKSNKIKVNLKPTWFATGQQVKVYTTKKKAKSNKKAIFNKKTTKINNKFKSKKFKNKKKLYVRARGYVKKNGKTKYGAWSKIKKVTKK